METFVTANGGIIAVEDSVPDDPEDFTFTAGGVDHVLRKALDDDGNANNGLRTRAASSPSLAGLPAFRDPAQKAGT